MIRNYLIVAKPTRRFLLETVNDLKVAQRAAGELLPLRRFVEIEDAQSAFPSLLRQESLPEATSRKGGFTALNLAALRQ